MVITKINLPNDFIYLEGEALKMANTFTYLH